MIFGLLVTFYILTILCVVFLERKSPTEALLWVLVLICLPYVGMILYLVFGSTMGIKITAYVRKKRLKLHHLCPDQKAVLNLDGKPLSEEDRQVIRFNTAYNNSRLTCYRDIRIFTTGKDHYHQLFADIAATKTCIYIEFYTIHSDEVGRALVDALKKSDRGRDRVGTVRLPCKYCYAG